MRDESKQEWNHKGSIESVNAGSLQRIADASERTATASEAMARDHVQLLRDVEYYKQANASNLAECERLGRVIAGLRGYVRRLKKEVRT